MLQAQRCDASMMHLRAHDPAGLDCRPRLAPITIGFGKQPQGRRLHPCFHLIHGGRQWSRRRKDLWMGDDRQELMDARPWYRPRRAAFGELDNPRKPRRARRNRRGEHIRVCLCRWRSSATLAVWEFPDLLPRKIFRSRLQTLTPETRPAQSKCSAAFFPRCKHLAQPQLHQRPEGSFLPLPQPFWPLRVAGQQYRWSFSYEHTNWSSAIENTPKSVATASL